MGLTSAESTTFVTRWRDVSEMARPPSATSPPTTRNGLSSTFASILFPDNTLSIACLSRAVPQSLTRALSSLSHLSLRAPFQDTQLKTFSSSISAISAPSVTFPFLKPSENNHYQARSLIMDQVC